MSKIFISLFCWSIILFSSGFPQTVGAEEPITISARNNALTAAVNYLSAKKNCQIDKMEQFSLQLLKLDEDERTCQKHQLQNAEVTDYIMASSDLALVSTKLDYPDKIVVQTSPVVKVSGKWKFVTDINNHHSFVTTEKIKPEIVNGINTYLNSIKTANQKGMKMYGKKLGGVEEEQDGILAATKSASFEFNVAGVKMIAETVAITSIKTKINGKLNEQVYVVYLEDNKWKVISDRFLLTASIPKNENPVKVD